MQGDFLISLQDIDGVIRLLAKSTCEFNGIEWHCILLSPYCRQLTSDASIALFTQVSIPKAQPSVH